MQGCLGNEAVARGKAEEGARDEGDAKDEEIPVVGRGLRREK